ncbi:proton-translocating NADH-quinone oxidoreductase, chain L [Pirellula staleyi DSM 6068]|uniref:Proton-translocating NADH-quinone oxidoreductase, chain L n=1 Tax=Pirellula staleyi (strain ATCC 27377 / DSM 6068 / ICPB 4128) TaxID=530564 RepID=D2QWK9_PIRSD|nr:proton-conducting transporter membrane subunit [Pirellula staleyi]ADB17812.1 proton-translocating NADH-quinone oxidoreductase, chain L [Pirellula staleyi DSM 6068]
MEPSLLPYILLLAVVLPLASFFTILLFANQLGKMAAWIATGAIASAAILSFLAMFGIWLPNHWPASSSHHGHAEHGEADHHDEHHGEGEHGDEHHGEKPHGDAKPAGEKHAATEGLVVRPAAYLVEEAKPAEAKADAHKAEEHKTEHAAAGHTHSEHGDEDHSHDNHAHAEGPITYSGEYYLLGKFGNLRMSISYYIDALTISMFCMVTLIATCIHFYAMGYMHDELAPITDKEVTLSNGKTLRRPGRFPRFFQALSLFCFSMLGLVLSGNIAMVFCFWELVGICSWFLIGFYIERNSASTAANKAFIANRVGDFGMIIGLMALWASLGTFAFGDIDLDGDKTVTSIEQGIFSKVRPASTGHTLEVPAAMVEFSARDKVAAIVLDHVKSGGSVEDSSSEVAAQVPLWRSEGFGYGLLVVAGLGIFCGCVGKSAQFPLHVWLPDAMEGPTPVSALVHSATMVAAGVYLVGRFYPVFPPETLLVIASVGCITLFIGATIAITATDIKRVLAYSTISQLGYMMLALGVGGWAAGLAHLVTHAFFKSLLFMCSGSVIHAVHTNDMRRMGGLIKKMPITALTMLIGCLAIAGCGVPFIIGFSGYYSKDAILEQAYSLATVNGTASSSIFFLAATGGAAITAFYMFRMWFLTFVGKPRDQEAYDHAHESPPVMFMPLVILSVFAISIAWNINLIGFGLVAAAFFIVKGVQDGWFKSLSAQLAAAGHDDHAHGDHGNDSHADHGHDNHGHGEHGHDEHSHDDHGHAASHAHHDDHGHQEHGHGDHGHDAHDDHGHDHAHAGHHGGGEWQGLSWAWVGTMLACSVIGGLLIQPLVPSTKLDTLNLTDLLEQARPAGTLSAMKGQWIGWTWPNEHDSHVAAIKVPVTLMATGTWIGGILLASMIYWFGYLKAEDARRQFAYLYSLLVNKWYFDELYAFIFVKPTLVLSKVFSGLDKNYIDKFLDGVATTTVGFSKRFEFVADRTIVDGLVNVLAGWCYATGLSLKSVQTGKLRQYVMFIVVGAVAVFVVISFFWSPSIAGVTGK